MLYVTTREKNDAYTANRTILDDFGPDGGAYLPFRMPFFTKEQLEQVRAEAERLGLDVSAYVRMVVMKEVNRDSHEGR